MRTIQAIYLKGDSLTRHQLQTMKSYSFNIDIDAKIGDLISSESVKSNLAVAEILPVHYNYITSKGIHAMEENNKEQHFPIKKLENASIIGNVLEES
jgi:hypothetical protein